MRPEKGRPPSPPRAKPSPQRLIMRWVISSVAWLISSGHLKETEERKDEEEESDGNGSCRKVARLVIPGVQASAHCCARRVAEERIVLCVAARSKNVEDPALRLTVRHGRREVLF